MDFDHSGSIDLDPLARPQSPGRDVVLRDNGQRTGRRGSGRRGSLDLDRIDDGRLDDRLRAKRRQPNEGKPDHADLSRFLKIPAEIAALTMPPPRITILLSTYNGEKYLASQLDSFLQQADVDWHVAWRDDGSSDASLAIMEAFERRVGPERCAKSDSSGQHLGAAGSFMQLLAENQDANFAAFADQDDRWLPAKLARSLAVLGNPDEVPTLYCARQMLTDEELSYPVKSMKFAGSPGFPACLTQNIATGSTIVMNEAAARLVAAIPLPEGANHDWWSYIVVSACGGTVIYDNKPSMLYRQHAKNMIGSPMRAVSRAIAALERGPRRYMTMMRRHIEQLFEYRDLLHPLAVAELELIRNGLAGGYGDKIAALSCPFFTRATKLENLLFRFWFLTH